MDVGVWIIICLFASMGFVQMFGWLRCVYAKPKALPCAYTVVPLSNDAAELEQQIRYELLCRRWSSCAQHNYLVFVDNGMDKECGQICEHLLAGTYGVFFCTPQSLGETLNQFNNLQTGSQGI